MPTIVRRVVTASVCFLLVAGSAGPTSAQISDAEANCRARVAKSFAKVVRTAHRAVGECHILADRGELGATDCNDPATASLAAGLDLTGTFAKLESVVAEHCTGAPGVLAQFLRCPFPAEETDDGGTTTGIDTWNELLACWSAQLNEVIRGSAGAALGAPEGPLGEDAQRCHGTIAKVFGKILDVTFRERARCQIALDENGGAVGFECASSDPQGKIARTIENASRKVVSACAASASQVDSCATQAAGIGACAVEEHATRAAGGLSALAWELPGVCPAKLTMRFDFDPDRTDVDLGWSGLLHDAVAPAGHDVASYAVSCDADCSSCIGGLPELPADHCRCRADSSVVCAGNADCASAGGSCECYLSPPVPVVAGGTPYCVTSPVISPPAGSLDVVGGLAELDVEIRQRVHSGALDRPCPVCTAGVCANGPRDGLPCRVDSAGGPFGETSFDCPPFPGSNVTGEGARQALRLAVEPASLAAELPCDAPEESTLCPCSSCSLDNTIACSSDEECADLGAGVCRTDGLHGGVAREANSCGDGICHPGPSAPQEGQCDESDRYCDGFVEPTGRGIVACGSNSDCRTLDPICPDGDCGACMSLQPRECFLDPIESNATSGVLTGAGCMPATTKPSLNTMVGLPGPWRMRQAYSLHRALCADGSAFEAPGGSSCP